MTVYILGQVSLSDVCPLLAEALAALTGAQLMARAELEGKLAGLANVLAAITVAPPSLGATIEAAIATVASLQLAISGPTVTLQADAIVGLIADLNASLALLIPIASPTASVGVYVYDGPSTSMGAEVQSAISGSLPGVGAGDRTRALILATTDGAAWEALATMMRTA